MKSSQGGFGHDNNYELGTSKDEWLTPPYIIQALGEFDLDPCCAEQMPWKTAANCFTRKDDGLNQLWYGRVWCNPPYGKETVRWLSQCAIHGNAIALTFARTDTVIFHEIAFKYADAVFFFRARLKFWQLDGTEGGTAGAPSCLIIFGKENVEAVKKAKLRGKLIMLNQQKESNMRYECLGKNIIVKPDPAEDMVGGIIIPEQAREKTKRGTIIAIGTGVEFTNGTKRPLLVNIGDRIMYGEYAGLPLTLDGEEVLFMREEEVIIRLLEDQ